MLDEAQLDRFDRQLDEGFAELAAAFARLTAANMREHADRFAEAPAADAIPPVDF